MGKDVNFFSGRFGILKEYEAIRVDQYNNSEALNVLKYDRKIGIMRGSNCFAAVLVNELVSDLGLEVANPIDLEGILSRSFPPVNLRHNYTDSALILIDNNVDENTVNLYLAENIRNQLKKINKFKTPRIIPLSELKLINDEKSPYKLSFQLKDNAKTIYTPQFGPKNDRKVLTHPRENRLPTVDKYHRSSIIKRRKLEALESGLSALSLRANLNWTYSYYNLAGSGPGGRIVLVAK
ncbi:MAG: hypothetical protein JSW73_02505 [Candidatus Woesearchaeota archaeon]|nr:MAG: hypothetical protein JSW73_02505 [Candidatus Woesearchaeota archaeon]